MIYLVCYSIKSMNVKNDYTFDLVGKRFKLPPESAKKLKRIYVNKGYSLAFYHPESRRINLVKHRKDELLEYAEGMNFRTGAILHKSGLHITPKRSIKQLQKMLPGFEKVDDAGDFYSRILTHETIHKALDNIGELRASMEFDNIHV